MDTAIIDAWEHRRVQENDDAYEGRISLGPPNDVAAAYKRKDQCTAVAVHPSSGRQSGSFDGQHIPPAVLGGLGCLPDMPQPSSGTEGYRILLIRCDWGAGGIGYLSIPPLPLQPHSSVTILRHHLPSRMQPYPSSTKTMDTKEDGGGRGLG
jgi:hypothetical protein